LWIEGEGDFVILDEYVCERGGEWRGVRVFVWLKSKSKKRGRSENALSLYITTGAGRMRRRNPTHGLVHVQY